MHLITYWEIPLFVLLLPFYFFGYSFRFIDKPDSSSDLNYFHEIIQFFIQNCYCSSTRSKHFLVKAASVDEAAAPNTNRIKILLANGLSTFFIKRNPFFSNGSIRLPYKSSRLSYFMQLSFWWVYISCRIICKRLTKPEY